MPESHLVWFRARGVWPTGWMLHACDNPRCVNIEHLFEGDNSDNIKDCVEKGRHPGPLKTHCPSGHEYTPENTYCRPSRPTQRQCRACLARSSTLAHHAKRKPRSDRKAVPV